MPLFLPVSYSVFSVPEPINATRIERVEGGKGTGFDSHPEESRRAKAMKINEELLPNR